MILIEDAHKVFDLWIDKTQSPYFTSGEKDTFLQRAMINLINKKFNPAASHVMERTIRDVEDISDLIEEVTAKTDAVGRLYDSIVTTALSGREVMYILNAARSGDCGETVENARFVRHNDYFAQNRNSFKEFTSTSPVFRVFKDYTKYTPVGIADVYQTVLLKPLIVTLDDPTNSGARGGSAIDIEFSENLFNELIYLALTEAGISIREADLYQVTTNEATRNE